VWCRNPLALDATLLEILGLVAKSSSPVKKTRHAAANESSRARRRYAHDAQLILQKRFRERFRLEDVARELYVSTFHLCRLFKEETGIPMHRYVNRLRLRESLEQLTDGAPLTELALSLGFAGTAISLPRSARSSACRPPRCGGRRARRFSPT